MTAGGEVITRPDGRQYRARKPPASQILGGCEPEDESVIVWRTHDLDRARKLADLSWRQLDGEDLPANVTVGWFKTVPWDTAGCGYDRTVIETEPGARGATPAVMFWKD
jgi:transposase